jgi:hypothetical protein
VGTPQSICLRRVESLADRNLWHCSSVPTEFRLIALAFDASHAAHSNRIARGKSFFERLIERRIRQKVLNPGMGRIRRLIARWSCSIRLLRYLNWRILMGVPRPALMASRCRRLSVRQNPLRALPYKASSRKARDCLTFGESNADGGLVPGTGLEPASCEAADFKSAMFTNFITPAGVRRNGRDSTIVQRPCQTSPSAARKFAHRAPQPPYQGPRLA